MSFEKVEVQETKEMNPNLEVKEHISNRYPERSLDEMEKYFEKVYKDNGFLKEESGSRKEIKAAYQESNGKEDIEQVKCPEKNAYQMSAEELMDELGINKEDYKAIKERNGTEKLDGTYEDKETGRLYDSFDDWMRYKYTLAKKLYTRSESFKVQANKEWARYKNSEENGETFEEKRAHYLKSQEFYSKSRECKEKVDAIMNEISAKQEKLDAEKEYEEYLERSEENHAENVKYLYETRSLRFKDYTREQYEEYMEQTYGSAYENWCYGEGDINFEEYVCEDRGCDQPEDCPLLNQEKRLDVLYETWHEANHEANMFLDEGDVDENKIPDETFLVPFDDFIQYLTDEYDLFDEWLLSESEYGYELEDLKRYEEEKIRNEWGEYPFRVESL